MTSDDDYFIVYGTRERQAESRMLTAGPLSVLLQDGNLGTVRFMGHDVLRAVSFLVRDRDWGTCGAEIRDLLVDASERHFSIRYRARYAAPSGANLDCEMHIAGSADGRLTFDADCVSDANFETARAGFAVLHPVVGVAGQEVTVEHGGGSIEQSRWPDLIEPWQPFKDIVAITHTVAHGIEAVTRFKGDVFEMEDQRNWTDGSYKTYVRPLALPWPYLIGKGEKFSQGVDIAIRARPDASPAAAAGEAVTVSVVETGLALPEIGVGLRPESFEHELAALDTLAKAGARHLIAHFDPLAGHGPEALRGYAEIAGRSGLKVTLELALPCIRPLDEELSGIARMVKDAGLTLDTLFVSPSVDRQSTPPGSKWPDCPPLEDIYAAARKAFPGVRLGGGMMSYFTEFNRKRVPGALVDYVSHCTNPIVHAADDLSVMQTFEALRYVVKSVRAIYGDKPYRIGPSTIAMRQNPYGSATKDNPALIRIPMANVDPRHNGRFGAAWTLAYAAVTAAAGLEVLTLSTLAGPFGLIAGEGEPLAAGDPRPLAHIVAALGALSGERLHRVETSRPDAVLGIGSAATILLANITPAKRRVALAAKPRAVEILNDGFEAVAVTDTFELGPYACARLSR
jgi:hypothetical protein